MKVTKYQLEATLTTLDEILDFLEPRMDITEHGGPNTAMRLHTDIEELKPLIEALLKELSTKELTQ